MDKDFTNLTDINNFNKNIINESLTGNATSNKFLLDDTSSKLLFLGIIFVLFILLIISILILVFLFFKKKKVNSVSNHNMILNRIILKHPNNNIKINAKGFQPLQNTSNVSTSNIQPNNNLFNEIKSENLKDEIHKIINTSSSLEQGKRKRKKISDSELIKNENKDNQDILMDNININQEIKNSIKDNVININDMKKENSNINTQELEKEIKEQIKKYVIDENNP